MYRIYKYTHIHIAPHIKKMAATVEANPMFQKNAQAVRNQCSSPDAGENLGGKKPV